MRKFPLFFVLILLVNLLWVLPVQPGSAQGSASDLLEAVNQFRAANGLPPYRADSALMAAAQGHSEYQAGQGGWSHSGPGGSTSTQRAAAAGYGGNASIRCTENVAVNTRSAGYAIEQWQDAVHLAALLSNQYTEAGTGAAASGGMTYYTLKVCYIQGSAGSSQTSPTNPSSPATAVPAAPVSAGPAVGSLFQISTAEPGEDGSIVHVVEAGENPFLIAQAYGISEPVLLAQNNLGANPVIFPGQRLIIRHAFTPTPTMSETLTPTPTRTLRPTLTPTRTPAPIPTRTETPLPTLTPTSTPEPVFAEVILTQDPVLLVIAFLAVSGALLMLVGGLMRRGR
jgi:LysM repeat protein